MRLLFRLPWRKPISGYDSDGPRGPECNDIAEFDLDGVQFRVSVTPVMAPTTMRTRYCVECLDCSMVLHPATTGTSWHLRYHMQLRHCEPGTECVFRYADSSSAPPGASSEVPG